MQAQRISTSGLLAAMFGVAVLEILTGFILLPFYRSDAAHAYNAVSNITNTPYVGFLRNLHHWSSAALIIFGAIYILIGLFTGTYLKPNHWLWVESILLFLLGMGMQLTGHLLPFDQQAVRTAVVETGIAADAPTIGTIQANLMRGGEAVSEHTLTLWYFAHILVLSVIMCSLLAVIYGTAKNLKIQLKFSWILLAIAICTAASIVWKAPLGLAATAADYGDSAARPEWYIIPLHSLLGLMQDKLHWPAFIGTMVIPGIAVLVILLLPWLQRKENHIVSGTLGAVGALALIGLSMYSAADVAPVVGEQIATVVDAGYPGTPTKLDPKLIAQGRQLFVDQGCDACHVVNGKGGKVGPDLSDEGNKGKSLEWQEQHIKDPKSANPGSTMPAFKDLKADELTALAQYVMSLKKK